MEPGGNGGQFVLAADREGVAREMVHADVQLVAAEPLISVSMVAVGPQCAASAR